MECSSSPISLKKGVANLYHTSTETPSSCIDNVCTTSPDLESAHARDDLVSLASSLSALDSTAEQLTQLIQHVGACPQQQPSQSMLGVCEEDNSVHQAGNEQHSEVVQELQQQLAALQAEKQRVEADRQEMAVKQGNYKGIIAQLEGALSYTERKVKDQLGTIERLQAQVTSLTTQLQEAQGAAAQTPIRCKEAARMLQAEADRASDNARTNEAQVRKLKQLVQLEARELSELLDFAEQERLTLLEKEAALHQEIGQTRDRLGAAESAAADARAGAAALQQQLEEANAQLEACQSRVEELQTLLSSTTSRLQQSELQVEMLAAERDAVARNLVTAEAELVDVGEYSTKMFRQVRFISHMLDKNSTVLSKLPDFANLARDLRALVAANASNWERRDTDKSTIVTAAYSASQVTGASVLTDTAVSGARDVMGKA